MFLKFIDVGIKWEAKKSYFGFYETLLLVPQYKNLIYIGIHSDYKHSAGSSGTE